MVDKCLKQFSKSRHSIGHLLWRCFIDWGVGAGEGEEHDIISESPHFFLFPLSFKPYFTHSFIDHLEPWLQKHTRHKNYLSHQGSQMDKKAVWDRLLDSVKPNASGKQPFDVKLNSPIYEHAILNTKSTLNHCLLSFQDGLPEEGAGTWPHVYPTSNLSSFRIVFQMHSGEQ